MKPPVKGERDHNHTIGIVKLRGRGLVFDNSRAVRREIVDPGPMGATSTDVSRHKYIMVGAMCVRREQEVPSTDAQHQSEHEGEPWVVFGATDDQAELEGETGKNSTTTVDVTVRAKATGGGTRESTVRTGRRSGNTPPNQTGNEEDINPVLLINSSEEEKRAWLSEVHNLIMGHMGFHRTIMKNLNRK
jgi:hypothetical protein